MVEQSLAKLCIDPDGAVRFYLDELSRRLPIKKETAVLQVDRLAAAAQAGRQEFEKTMYNIALEEGVIAA